MNVLPRHKQVMVLNALVEGNSVRSTARIAGVQKNTVLRLLARAGEACERIMDETMRDLEIERLELDELWAFVGKKQGRLTEVDRREHPDWGDQYVFFALASESRLIPAFRIGRRDFETTLAFMQDLERRLAAPVQIASDAFGPYIPAIELAFLPSQVTYCQLVKQYRAQPAGRGRYAPPAISRIEKDAIIGRPDMARVSTSYVERQHATCRLRVRRLSRLSLAFSRKLENLRAAIALYCVHYDMIAGHRGLNGLTPAMAAAVTDRFWHMEDVLDWCNA